jgi:hypothetical protein
MDRKGERQTEREGRILCVGFSFAVLIVKTGSSDKGKDEKAHGGGEYLG